MKKVIAHLVSTAPFQFSRHYNVEKLEKESAADYEKRTWRHRLHVDEDDNVFIPPMMFKKCVESAAKYIGMQIPGKGKATYTKHFEAGVMVVDRVYVGVKGKDVKGLWLFVPSDGKPGGSKRVEKCFPVLDSWKAKVIFYVLDQTITEEVFRTHLIEAGRFRGVGAFRPANRGYFGRFDVEKIEWDV